MGPTALPDFWWGPTAVQGRTEGAESPCGPALSPQQRCPPPSGDLQSNLPSGRQLPHLCTAAVAVSSCAVCTAEPFVVVPLGPDPGGLLGTELGGPGRVCWAPGALTTPASFTGCWRGSGGDLWNLRSGCDLGQGGQLPGVGMDSQSWLCCSAVWPWARALPSLSLW